MPKGELSGKRVGFLGKAKHYFERMRPRKEFGESKGGSVGPKGSGTCR